MGHWEDDWQGQLLISPTEHAAQVGEGEHGDRGEQVDLQQGGHGEGDIEGLAHHVESVEQYQEVVESLVNLLTFQNNKGEYVPDQPHAGHHHKEDPLHKEGHSDQPGRGVHLKFWPLCFYSEITYCRVNPLCSSSTNIPLCPNKVFKLSKSSLHFFGFIGQTKIILCHTESKQTFTKPLGELY